MASPPPFTDRAAPGPALAVAQDYNGNSRQSNNDIETFCEFTFEAAHKTPPYSDLHGHSFLVQVFMRGPSDPTFGWSHNLFEIEPIIQELRSMLDHRCLNDVEGLSVPTLENVARWLWHRLAPRITGLDRITVCRGREGQREGTTYRGGAS
jgi:6-pyruvoyltetrahydropterin/6-carboxytetrahydropterin synthase